MKPLGFHFLVQNGKYLDISERLEGELWQEIQYAFSEIQRRPKRHKDEYTGYCRYNLDQFPYNILYVEYPNRIRIQVFRHNSRRQTFGSYRKTI